MTKTDLHVVVLPWSAFGHIMPFYQLSIALAKAGVKVSYVSTPKIIQRLPKIPTSLSHLMNFLVIPFPDLYNGLLPEGAEATVDVPFDKIPFLRAAYDLLEIPFKNIVLEQSPDWIIIDGVSDWAVDIAREKDIPICYFSVFSAATLAFFGSPDFQAGQKTVRSSPESLMSSSECIELPSSIAYKKHEADLAFRNFYESNGTNRTDAHRAAKIIDSCQAIAVRTCTEFESDYLNLLKEHTKQPVIPIGVLPQEKSRNNIDRSDSSWGEIFKWLDEQETKSVVFVSFGSECKLSKDQIFEIAYGLELSKLPFLWVLKKPDWANDDLDALPLGFGDRTQGRGVVSVGWAPQKEILAHNSIGGSLFHSGWGSVIETLQFGHCMVVLPFIIDQPLNARLLVEKELAVEVEKAEDGSFSRDDIAKSLRYAMLSIEGEGLRAKTRDVGAIFSDTELHQEHYIGRFLELLKGRLQD